VKCVDSHRGSQCKGNGVDRTTEAREAPTLGALLDWHNGLGRGRRIGFFFGACKVSAYTHVSHRNSGGFRSHDTLG
jgi:hypothetical protein